MRQVECTEHSAPVKPQLCSCFRTVLMYRARLVLKHEQQERNRQALLEAGLNPYEESRLIEMAAVRAKQQRHVAERIQRGRDAIAARIVAEEQQWQANMQVQAQTKVRAPEHMASTVNRWLSV